ncbi:unnamed protein product [Ectocarpus sp. CCAP 1310/34]|nr:unnamed protein product [Ectocarpus sp. CCAP 1310/34]
MRHICMPVRRPPRRLWRTRGSCMPVLMLSSVAAVRSVLRPTAPAPPTAVARLLLRRSMKLLLLGMLLLRLLWLMLLWLMLLLLRLLLLLFLLTVALSAALGVGVGQVRM